jgi:acetyltransferase
VLVAVAQMQIDLPELRELDINPLMADPAGVVAVDARVRLGAAGAASDRLAIRPYPSSLARRVDWAGRRLAVRPVRPEDMAMHEAFVSQVDPEDLRLRFFSTHHELPRSELARMVQIDYAREMAFVAVDDDASGDPEILGFAQAACDPDNVDAEFAILVRSDLKAQGLGRLLLDTLVGYLEANGTRHLVAHVLQENRFMRTLLGERGFAEASDEREPGAVRCTLDLTRVSPDQVRAP